MFDLNLVCKFCNYENKVKVRTSKDDIVDVEPILLKKLDRNKFECEINVKCDKCRLISRYNEIIRIN